MNKFVTKKFCKIDPWFYDRNCFNNGLRHKVMFKGKFFDVRYRHTFMTVATQTVARLRGSTASSFIPATKFPGGGLYSGNMSGVQSVEM